MAFFTYGASVKDITWLQPFSPRRLNILSGMQNLGQLLPSSRGCILGGQKCNARKYMKNKINLWEKKYTFLIKETCNLLRKIRALISKNQYFTKFASSDFENVGNLSDKI